MSETYISIDVETMGQTPATGDMIELGAAVFYPEKEDMWSGDVDRWDTFSRCLGNRKCTDADLIKFTPWLYDAETREWWNGDPERFKLATQISQNSVLPQIAMIEFAMWVSKFPDPVIVGFPISFDFQFLWDYWQRYLPGVKPPFGHRGMCGKTMASIALNLPFKETSKEKMKELRPGWFRDDLPHTHRALDDAKEQAYLFYKIREELRRK